MAAEGTQLETTSTPADLPTLSREACVVVIWMKAGDSVEPYAVVLKTPQQATEAAAKALRSKLVVDVAVCKAVSLQGTSRLA